MIVNLVGAGSIFHADRRESRGINCRQTYTSVIIDLSVYLSDVY